MPERPSSPDAERGRKLHALVAAILEARMSEAEAVVGLTVEDAEAVLACVEYAGAMLKWANVQVDGGAQVLVLIEHPVDLKSLDIQDGGTVDFAVVIPGVICWVADWKFGRAWVPYPRVNRQLQAYLAGMAEDFACPTGHASTFQPLAETRAKTAFFEADELARVIGELKWIVQKAKEPEAPLQPSEWCQFCAAVDACPARASQALALVAPMPLAPADRLSALAPAERLGMYDKLRMARAWLDGALGSIDEAIIAGDLTVPGLTVGAGRTARKWVNVQEAERVLTEHLGAKAFSRELLTVAAAEKALKAAGVKTDKLVDSRGASLVSAVTGAPRVVRDGSTGLVGES